MSTTIKRALAVAILATVAIGLTGCKDLETGTTGDPVDLADIAEPDPRQHPTSTREPIVIGPEEAEDLTEQYVEHHADSPSGKPRLREEAEERLRNAPHVDLSGIKERNGH